MVGSPADCQTNGFTMHPVDLDIPGIHCVKIFDLDLDGDFDIVGGSEHTPYSTSVGLVWWRNDGGSPVQWTRFVIDGSFLHVMSVDVGDLNGDQYPDIVATSWENGKVAWWKNNGDPEFGWTSFDIVTGWTNPHDAVCFDIDADERLDVVAASSGNDQISIFYNSGGSTPSWIEQVVTSTFDGAKSVIVEDLNQDELPDLIGAGDGCDDIAWWKNLGGNPPGWGKQFITAFLNGSSGLDAEDMDDDGQLDIIGTGWEGDEVSFWICNDIAANSWTKTMVTNQLEIAAGAIGRDIDMDGDKDIIAAGKMPGELVLFVNDNNTFTKDVLFPGFAGGSALEVVDIDQDGDDDIVAGAGVLKELYWFENSTISTSSGDEKEIGKCMTVFPNPFSESFWIGYHLAEPAMVTITLFDALGNAMAVPLENCRKNAGNHVEQIHAETLCLTPGAYFIRIETEDTGVTGKIVMVNWFE